MPTLMYIHGYASTGNATKAQLLRRMFPDCRVVSPTLRYEQESPDEIQATLRRLMDINHVRLVVGSSFGGYHALCATQVFDGAVWCINPVNDVLATIRKVMPMLGADFYKARSAGMDGSASMMVLEEMLKVYDWDTNRYLGEIPQAERTYTVVGQMNENQVSIAETTFGGRSELWKTEGLIDYGSLIYIALERATSARNAIGIMTSLVAQYGYCSEGESFSVPFFGIRPVYLHSGVAQVVEIALHIGGAALGRSRGLLCKILFYERLDRDGIGCGRLHRLSTVVPHAGPGYCQQVQHHVFFVVTIGRRRTHGIVHFAHLCTADWQRRQHPGNVSFRHQRILSVVVNRFATTVAGACGEQHHRRRNQDFR